MTTTTAPPFDVRAWPHETVPCNLCGSTETTPIAPSDRYGLPTTIVQCVPCGLRYINPRMTAEGYDAFYRDGYRPLVSTLMKTPLTLAALEADQHAYAINLMSTIAPFLTPKGAVLDLGGSTGRVGRLIGQYLKAPVTVIDPSPTELARATDCQTICAKLEDVDPFPQATLGLLCRTVDHLLDPLGVLTRLRPAVSTLVVDIMAVDAWHSLSRYKVDHPYAFTEATITAMLEKAGWTPKQTWHRRNRQYFGLVCQ